MPSRTPTLCAQAAFAQADSLDIAALLVAESGRHDEEALWTMAEYLDSVTRMKDMPNRNSMQCASALRAALSRCTLDIALKLAAVSPVVTGLVRMQTLTLGRGAYA